ncbi:MAG: Lrp/AsnC family transcriptional regulator [Flavobacteriaceae bacterium]
MKLDEQDIQLLHLLQSDCKQTTKQYAHALGLSVTAVYERIKRLERSGTIEGYVALLNRKKVGRGFMVLCHIRLAQHAKESVVEFERAVSKLREVSECYHVSGDYDYILKIHVPGIEAYREFMVSKLTTIRHIGNTHSSFVIKEVKYSTKVDLEV